MKPLDLATLNLSGLNLIEASAGTGKTWTIAALYILLLLEKELRPEQILVVTYTKAATAELKDRIRTRISSTLEFFTAEPLVATDALEQLLLTGRPQIRDRARHLLTRALYSFDDAAIFTIHGFCQRALLENTFESGSLFGSDMLSDQSAIISRVCNDFWRARILTGSDEFIAYLMANNYTPEKLAEPFAGYLQNPELQVIPADPVHIPFEPLIEKRTMLYQQINLLWRSERELIVRQLHDARLNQRSYGAGQIEQAASELAQWLEGNNAALQCQKLDFFSAEKITSRITKASSFSPDHRFFTLCQELLPVLAAIDNALQEQLIACRLLLREWLAVELSRLKKQTNCRAYDDLLLDLHAALEGQSGPVLAERLRQRFNAALIDEFQDTDPVQWHIFKQLGAGDNYPLFLIGDPKQAIYSFRGADIFAYLKAGQLVTSSHRHTLDVNFRSTAPLLHAVSALFMNRPHAFLHQDIHYPPVRSGRSAAEQLLFTGIPDPEPLKLWLYPRHDQSAAEPKPGATRCIVQAIADEISRLVHSGQSQLTTAGATKRLSPGDVAVLVKSHRQAELVQEALRNSGIPSVHQGSSTIFQASEALDLLRILRAADEPHHGALVREALLTGIIGLDVTMVATFVAADEQPLWETWLEHFQQLQAAALTGGIVALVARLLDKCGVREALLCRTGGERSVTNILHCCELLHQIEREQGKSLAGLITWLEQKISAGEKNDAALLRLETDEEAVVIATIHSSKGLQYPVVFVPFAWDAPAKKPDRALFHNEQEILTLDLAGSDKSYEYAGTERSGEAMRLLYVALTRAEFRCYVVWGAINGAVASPLFELLHGDRFNDDKSAFYAQTDQEIGAALQHLAEAGIAVEEIPTSGTSQAAAALLADGALQYESRHFEAVIRDDWRVASFSSITSRIGHSFEAHDHDPDYRPAAPVPADLTESHRDQLSIFDFPRGAQAGTCLHEIFETLDFTASGEDAITKAVQGALLRSGFAEKWLIPVAGMVAAVVSAPLIADDPAFALTKLTAGNWQTELEFYLPVRQLDAVTLTAIFDGLLDRERFENYYQMLEQLSFRHSRGMLQGFIDMVFEHNGRFYLLDWKSNHLGMAATAYNTHALIDSMSRNAYVLQYHLYTLALDRLLKLKMPDYSYDRHFGGAIYVYLRGVERGSAASGIFFDRPSAAFISSATERMLV